MSPVKRRDVRGLDYAHRARQYIHSYGRFFNEFTSVRPLTGEFERAAGVFMTPSFASSPFRLSARDPHPRGHRCRRGILYPSHYQVTWMLV